MFLAAFLGCSLAIEVRAQIVRTVILPHLRRRLRRDADRRTAARSGDATTAPAASPWAILGAAAVEYDRTGDPRDADALSNAARALSRSLSDDERRQLGEYLHHRRTKEA